MGELLHILLGKIIQFCEGKISIVFKTSESLLRRDDRKVFSYKKLYEFTSYMIFTLIIKQEFND